MRKNYREVPYETQHLHEPTCSFPNRKPTVAFSSSLFAKDSKSTYTTKKANTAALVNECSGMTARNRYR